eukprot:CAMPEP_0118933332 /NCGR_PEP_ID=MMETSP1169-20130426/11933_1 /TAXON_ID=36882 /ORGANISM="Pyramimonas obovata, Strain CCMP722" /LENGTH=340 /DNA_ID=CAMNT_0006876083 /DNA_START=37 /DNA_END=1059 /DNA_ORIENTATION=-
MATPTIMKHMALRPAGVAGISQQRQVRSMCALRGVTPAGQSAVTLRQMSNRFEALETGFVNRPSGLRGIKRQVKMNAAAEDEMGENELKDMAALDNLIDSMLTATAEEMPMIIGQSVMSLNQKFFLRIATRSDSISDPEAKKQLSDLAVTVMRLLDEMVKQTKTTMNTSGELLQKIVTAAADPATGEFMVPLAPENISAMRTAVSESFAQVDEGVIAQAYSWIRKSDDDGLKGMVEILQRVLQLYAAHTLVQGATPTAEEGTPERALEEVLAADVEDWQRLLVESDGAGYGTGAFIDELHKRMEGVVLGMANGSYTQRVLAEYLKEVEERAKEVFPKAEK